MVRLSYSPNSLECYRDNQSIATHADQFRAVSFCHHGNRTRSHDSRFQLAVPEVTKAETVPDFMQHHGHLVVDGQRGEVGRVYGDKARPIGHRGRPSHPLSVDVLSWLVKLDSDRWRGEPEAPHNDGDRNKVLKHGHHATPASQPRGSGG